MVVDRLQNGQRPYVKINKTAVIEGPAVEGLELDYGADVCER